MKRRQFIKSTVAASIGIGVTVSGISRAACADETLAAEKPDIAKPAANPKAIGKHPVRLGAPFFSSQDDPEKLAHDYKQTGYRAAYCPNASLDDMDRVRAIELAFKTRDITIAEVGRWCNLMDADPNARSTNLKRVTDGLALADEVGARCCVDIAGSFNPDDWAGADPRNVSPEFFELAVENARKIIDAVQPKRAKFAYEMMPWAMPDSVDNYLELIRAIDRPAFGVHLDPSNLINCPRRIYDNTTLLNDCFDRLGPYIASCHAKDMRWVPGKHSGVQLEECEIGLGQLDYSTYLRRLATLPGDVPLMIEHMNGREQYDRCRSQILKTGREAGVVFDWM